MIPAVDALRLVELTEDHAATVAGWFQTDDEARARLDMYDEHPRWWRLVESDDSRHGYIGVLGSEPVGLVDIEIDDATANIALMVRFEHRNVGLGRRLIALAKDEAAHLGARELVGYIEPDNDAAIRCCLASGLELDALDDDDMLPARAMLARTTE
jgi:RimJ/RimL family protein N-acetyltransferase